ncbi:DinB family protein [Occallatibacter savannae]|uniref:DinB family protein n=1 Tax=Occallatibacter savannae TaxID=1002691 RepID=UPI000D6860E4|nr:DinB family protein [Occallatibacter savannae]
MLPLIDELLRHKWWANSQILHSVEQHPPAAEDPELHKLLHHILVSNRYWLLLTLGQPFVDEQEKHIPESQAALTSQFDRTELLELDWLSRATSDELDRQLQPRALPGIAISVAQAMMQTVLHSQGHRSQCATRLRALGGTPAPTDFVLWVREQKASADSI